MAGFEFNDKELKKKIRAIKSGATFFKEIHKDAGAFVQEKMITEVISGQYVGVISGNLIRSQALLTFDYYSTVGNLVNIAPYMFAVAERTKKLYDATFWQITQDIYGNYTNELMGQEFKRMIKQVDNRITYRYETPFPA